MNTTSFRLHSQDYRSENSGPSGPKAWLLILHGILGSGVNWRSISNRLVKIAPDWGITCVDLRHHGKSQGTCGPNTIHECANDLVRLEKQLGRSFSAICAHSFGSKVAIEFAAQKLQATEERADEQQLKAVWVLDADPAPRQDRLQAAQEAKEQIFQILDQLLALPKTIPSRKEFEELMLKHGHPLALVRWLGMNLEAYDQGFKLRIDVQQIKILLKSYLEKDCWAQIERLSSELTVDVILGGNSSSVSTASKEKLADWHEQGIIALHTLENAGHWVHIDAPQQLIEVIVQTLPILE